MSFLVKAVLGQRVVHPPPSHRAVEGTATTSTHAEAEDESGAADREFEKTPRIPTRTLLLRAKTCTVVQDLREALRELERSDDLAALATTSEVSFLTHLLRRYPEDDEIGKSTLHLLASLGDASSTAYRSLDMEMDEKVAQSGGFLDELLSEVPLFMEHLSKSASDQLSEDAFWAKFHALQLLQQLEEHEPSKMHRLLLSCHGMSALLVTLNDSSNDGMLRNETLVLLKSLTTMDTELQTILAFDNAFEVLFSVIESENGIHGGMIVDDCFTTMRNMLRGNKATQKFFRELDCAKRFCPILDAAAAYSRECERGRPTADPIVQMDGMERQITRQAVSIIACLLRESEKGDEQAANLFQCGVLHSLTGVATCCGEEVVDDLTRIEAFRAIAQVLRGCSRASDDFLKMRIATTPNDGRKNGSLGQPAISGILEVLFHRTDATVLNSVMQVVEELLSPTDAAHNQRFARFALHGFASEAVTAPPGPQECGYLLARALFGTSSSATSTAKFYAALFFQRLLQVPGVAEELLHRPWGSVMGKPTATRGADLSSTCFLALLEYFLQSIRGGLLAQSMDTTALGGFARVFLTWMEVAPTAAGLLTKDLQHFHSLLDLAARPKTPVHVRFWCGAIAADVCLRCPQLSKLPGEFVAKLGSSFFTNAVFDVAANSHQWSSPAALLTSAAPPLYDDVFVLRLSQIVEEMSRIMEHHSGQQEPAPRTSFSSDDINPFAVPSMAVEEVVPHTAAVPSSDATLSLLPSMDTTTAQTVRAEEMVLLEQRYSNSQEELGRLCGDIESLRGENARLMELLANERARSEEVAAVNAQLESHVQLQQEAADHGDRQLEEMLTSARHQIASLEEALGTREEEHQTLLVSLGALEEQLRQATSSFQMEMERVSSTLQQVTQERDELLLLVGHLDVECESVRAGSASVSPSRLGVSPRFGGDAGMVAAPLHYVPVPYHDESGLFGETVHQAPLPQPDAMSAGATEVPPQPLQHTLPAGTPELAHSGSLIPTRSHDNYQFGIIPIELETSASHIVPSREKSQERPFNQSPAQVEADVFHPERSAPPPALVESCQSVDGFVNPSASGSRHLWANVNGSASNPFDTAEDACNVAAFQGSLELQPSQLAGCTPLAVTNADFNPFAGDDDDELDDLR